MGLQLLLGLWALLFLLSIGEPLLTPKAGDGFTRGLNRLVPFFGYQAVAAAVSFGTAYLARRVRSRSRRWALLGLVPIAITCLITLGLLLAIASARL